MTDTPNEQATDEAAAEQQPQVEATPAPEAAQPETTPVAAHEPAPVEHPTEPLYLNETAAFPVPAPPAAAHQPFAPQHAVSEPATPYGVPTAQSSAAPAAAHTPVAQPQPFVPAYSAPDVPGGYVQNGYAAPAPAAGDPYASAPGSYGGPEAAIFGTTPEGASEGAAFGLGDPGTTHAAPHKVKKRRGWVPVVSTAAITAVIVSLGSVALTGGFDRTPTATTSSSTTQVGQQSGSSVSVPVSASTEDNPDWQAVSSAVAPSVVSIQVTLSDGEAEGSGVVLDAEGHVLTNNHVVAGATNKTVQVTLYDGRIYDATVVGTDSTTDLAVVKLENPPSDLKSAVFADSGTVTVGDPVMAVGNPLGLSNTVTTGIVSALNRPVSTSTSETSQSTDTVVTNAIQIDAAINPGNSGGPLFNAQGEVIGITSSIATLSSTSDSSGSIGLGFAIPANLASSIGGQLIKSGTAEHAYLGVTLSDSTATADGTKRQGAKVESVLDSSPASVAGLQVGDVITGIDGSSVSGAESLTAFVRAYASGDKVKLTLVRDGKSLDVDVTLATREDDTSTSGSGSSSGSGSDDGSGSGDGSSQDGSGQNGYGSGQDGSGDGSGQGLFPWGGSSDGQG